MFIDSKASFDLGDGSAIAAVSSIFQTHQRKRRRGPTSCAFSCHLSGVNLEDIEAYTAVLRKFLTSRSKEFKVTKGPGKITMNWSGSAARHYPDSITIELVVRQQSTPAQFEKYIKELNRLLKDHIAKISSSGEEESACLEHLKASLGEYLAMQGSDSSAMTSQLLLKLDTLFPGRNDQQRCPQSTSDLAIAPNSDANSGVQDPHCNDCHIPDSFSSAMHLPSNM
jgi:hypothetical protein